MPEYPKPNAVVLTADGVFYSNGHRGPLTVDPTDLGAVLQGASRVFRDGEGVIVIDAPMPTDAPALDGWNYTAIRPWTTFTGHGAIVHLGWLPEVQQAPGPLLGGFKTAEDIAWRLGRYHNLVGAPWRFTAGVSGCAALRSRYTDPRPGRQPLWQHQGPKGIRGAGPLIWTGQTPPEGAPGVVVMLDINGQYLAALKNARLAWGALENTGSCAFDPAWAGYWELSAEQIPHVLLDGKIRPPVIRQTRIHKGGLWVTTPVAKYLTDLLGSIDVLDSWTCKNAASITRTFAERLATVRAGDLGPMGPTEPAIKRTYTDMVGMMARPGGSIYRADWHCSVVDLARVNFLRRLDKIDAAELPGMSLVEVRTDAAFYHLTDPKVGQLLVHAAVTGTGPGTFKNPRTFTVAEYRASMRNAR